MESRYSHHIHNWLSYAQSQRLQVIGGAFVAAVVGLSAAAFVFRKGAVSYSRTAEVACTLRYEPIFVNMAFSQFKVY